MIKYLSRKVDPEYLIEKLQQALILEICGIKKYFKSIYNMEGPERASIAEEMQEIMHQEMKHCRKLADRICELGGEVDWEHDVVDKIPCPENNCTYKHLECHMKIEEQLMDLYYAILEYTENKDNTTHYIISKIMNDEERHYEELESFKEDIDHMNKHAAEHLKK
jgi:bacterioferritin (cytochrome b1)